MSADLVGASPTGTVKFATRDAIFSVADMSIVPLYIPEWEMTVRIKTLTAHERDAFEHSTLDQRGKKAVMDMHNIRARLAVLCLVDAAGNRMFQDQDFLALGQKNAAALSRIFNKAQELSGITDDDIEELAGQFKTDPKGDSTLNLPSPSVFPLEHSSEE